MTRTCSLAAFFLGLCVSRIGLADEPVSIPYATTQQIQQTVNRAIRYLETECAAWLNTRKCAACHHAGMPLWGLSEARVGHSPDEILAERFDRLGPGNQGNASGDQGQQWW